MLTILGILSGLILVPALALIWWRYISVMKLNREILKNVEAQSALRSLLQSAASGKHLDEILCRALDIVLSVSWLSFESKGAIFLSDGAEKIAMHASRGMSAEVLSACGSVPFGSCVCGKAASTRTVQYTQAVDDTHERKQEGMQPHGHYSIPIILKDECAGVLTLYLPAGHPKNRAEIEFLETFCDTLAGIIRGCRMEREREDLISELRSVVAVVGRSQKEWRETFDSINDVIFITDLDHRVIRANRATEQVTGVPIQQIIGKRCYELFHGLQAPVGKCVGSRCFHEGTPVTERFEEEHLRRTVEVTALPLPGLDSGCAGIIHVMRDITEQRKVEEQLRQAQKMEAVGQLAGGIAHDFNNILTGIVNCGQLLKLKLPKDSDLRTYAELILDSSRKGASLIKGLMAFSRKEMFSAKPSDLNEIVHGAAPLIRQIVPEDIELRIALSSEQAGVIADRNQIEQVLVNLAGNSRDAMPSGGVLSIQTGIIEFSKESMESHPLPPGAYVLLSVSDTGFGMDTRTVERAFEPFFTTKEVGKGTGLGLAMVYGIIRQHEGHIHISSSPGIGTTIKIYLPWIGEKPGEEPTGNPELPSGRGETILVAEDEPILRQIITSLLREFGYRAIAAENGSEAVRLFTEEHENISLVLMDVIMPKMNGKEAYTRMKHIHPGLKTVFMSGYTADVLKTRSILEDSLHVLAKPVSPAALLSKVRSVLES